MINWPYFTVQLTDANMDSKLELEYLRNRKNCSINIDIRQKYRKFSFFRTAGRITGIFEYCMFTKVFLKLQDKSCSVHLQESIKEKENSYYSLNSFILGHLFKNGNLAIVLGIIFLLSLFSSRLLLFYQKEGSQDFKFLHGLLSHKNRKIPMKKKQIGDPPQPTEKANLGRTKAKMGHFSKKGSCYSFEILQGLLSNKKRSISMKNKFQGPPYLPN